MLCEHECRLEYFIDRVLMFVEEEEDFTTFNYKRNGFTI